MKAVAYFDSLPIDHDESLVDIAPDRPSPGPRYAEHQVVDGRIVGLVESAHRSARPFLSGF